MIVVSTPAGARHEPGGLAAGAVALSLLFPAGEAAAVDEIRRLGRALPAGMSVLVGGRTAASYADALEKAGAALLADYAELRAALRSLGEPQAAAP